jgi:hypothetical protein
MKAIRRIQPAVYRVHATVACLQHPKYLFPLNSFGKKKRCRWEKHGPEGVERILGLRYQLFFTR